MNFVDSLHDRPLSGVAVLGTCFTFAVLGWVNLFVYYPGEITSRIDLLYELVINGGLAVLGIGLVYRTLNSELRDDDVHVFARWYFGAIVFVWGLLAWANFGDLPPSSSVVEYSRRLLILGGLAGLGGIVAGKNRARAKQNRRLYEEQKRQDEQIEEQRRTLQFINRLLRHDIANGLNVVSARSQILQSHDDEEVEEHATVIFERTEQLIDLTEDVREFSSALQNDPKPVEVTEIIESEAQMVQQTYPEANVRVRVPDPTEVLAGKFLSSAVANVIENAVEHNDREQPTVEVDVERKADNVDIRVADDGAGISNDRIEDILRSPDESTEPMHGIGLSLVETVLNRCGGSLEISDNEPRGTVIRLRLQRASS